MLLGGDGMKLSELFENCLTRSYKEASGEVSYAFECVGKTLYIYLEASNGISDWRRNLAFPAKAYRTDKGIWFAHRGFLSAWKILRPIVLSQVLNQRPSTIVSLGYSHGAAIATLCHEYLFYHRLVPSDALFGFAFASPRVLWGRVDDRRWEKFTVIRNRGDLVTHLPPLIFGFRHVGQILRIGEKGRYGQLEAHTPDAMLSELRRYEKEENSIRLAIP